MGNTISKGRHHKEDLTYSMLQYLWPSAARFAFVHPGLSQVASPMGERSVRNTPPSSFCNPDTQRGLMKRPGIKQGAKTHQ